MAPRFVGMDFQAASNCTEYQDENNEYAIGLCPLNTLGATQGVWFLFSKLAFGLIFADIVASWHVNAKCSTYEK